VAGYFIDIGVKNPNRLNEYILGIECDGAMYHSSAFARDRQTRKIYFLPVKVNAGIEYSNSTCVHNPLALIPMSERNV
jgi:hypothetical protein